MQLLASHEGIERVVDRSESAGARPVGITKRRRLIVRLGIELHFRWGVKLSVPEMFRACIERAGTKVASSDCIVGEVPRKSHLNEGLP
jgi:hypothetical protein